MSTARHFVSGLAPTFAAARGRGAGTPPDRAEEHYAEPGRNHTSSGERCSESLRCSVRTLIPMAWAACVRLLVPVHGPEGRREGVGFPAK